MHLESDQEARRRRTVMWVVGLAAVGLMFDGYDLVVYGTVVSTFLRNPNELGEVTPAMAGALGSYALIGVLVGALLAGTVGDIIGRRKVMLTAYAWFSVGMGVTALTHHAAMFGLCGSSPAWASVPWSPPRRPWCPSTPRRGRRTCSTRSPIPGSRSAVCWPRCWPSFCSTRSAGAGMFWIGALPLVTLLPLAIFKMPESVAWLAARGRLEEARAISARTGVPLPDEAPAARPWRRQHPWAAAAPASPGCSVPATGSRRWCWA